MTEPLNLTKKEIRAIAASLPPVLIILYIFISIEFYGISDFLFNPTQALIISFIAAVGLSPMAALEYKWEYELTKSELEIPAFLSALEGSIRGGLPLPKAIVEGAKYTKYLKKDLGRVVNALWAGETIDKAINYIRTDSPLLLILRDYIKVLSRSGEEVYRTIRDFREASDLIVNYLQKLREGTRSFLATIYMVMIVYVITTSIFMAFFIYPLSKQAAEVPLLSPVNPNAIAALSIYGALVESVVNGITGSYFTGSRHLASLLHSILLLFIALIVYTYILFAFVKI